MSIKVETVPTTITNITIEGDIDPQDRIKITLKNGDELYFAPEKDKYGRVKLVLDIIETASDIVDSLILPQNDEGKTMCGHDDCSDDEHKFCNEAFDVLSVITTEQYRLLSYIYINLDDDERTPQLEEPLFLWQGDRLGGGGRGSDIDQTVVAIDVVTLDS